jgi:hypothetical protein
MPSALAFDVGKADLGPEQQRPYELGLCALFHLGNQDNDFADDVFETVGHATRLEYTY